MTHPLRILVADDHASVRRGVINILTSAKNLVVCGEARNGDEAIKKHRELQPDVLLLDISMPDVNGLEVARRIRAEFASARIVIMTHHDALRILPRVLAVGALACVDKSRLSKDLLPAIESLGT